MPALKDDPPVASSSSSPSPVNTPSRRPSATGPTPFPPNNPSFDPFAKSNNADMSTAKTTMLRRALGIPQTEDPHEARVTRGESIANSYMAQPYLERDPTVQDWFRENWPSRGDAWGYAKSLFPFTAWIHRYNTTWLVGDLVAGITVGAVVVPQSMAYAKLANLPVEYGLYSSFMGVLIYWLFATSRDITIGPVAVMSQLVGNIVDKAAVDLPDIPGHIVASCLAVICGVIIVALGLLRLGFIVDFIPLPAIAAFMTGSAVNICAGQVPALFGISKRLNTRASTYLVIIHTFQNLHAASLDAAIGVTALALLYLLRTIFVQLGKRDRARSRVWFFCGTLRTVFVILLYTMISWLVNKDRRTKPAFALLGTVPRGFKHAAVPIVTSDIIKSFASDLPSAVIVLLIEHIAISKSFGRINGYTINPSQELIAIGVSNIFGPFLGAYPATGSFSRTAIKSKAGVKTPFAGVITAVVVLLAIYALPAMFFYIPNAGLAAVIIHAVGDLIVAPSVVYGFWQVSPLEVVIFFAGVIVTIFTTIEIGIYVTVATSAALLLFRIAKANGQFLGQVKVRSIEGNDSRHVYLPLDHADGTNPNIGIESPYPGVFVYRFTDSLLYPNANHYTDQITEYIMSRTKRHPDAKVVANKDRPWNDPAPRNFDPNVVIDDPRPVLKAVICDFSGVNNVDVTSVQVLVDVRNQLDRWSNPGHVEWHFANLRSIWVKRGLASVGFGRASTDAKPIFVVSEVAATQPSGRPGDLTDNAEESKFTGIVPLSSVDRPLFHVDIDSAVRSALNNIGISSVPGAGSSRANSYAASDQKVSIA